MARNHARIHVAIWQDEDFRRLRPSPQRMYLFLLSQPNLTHLGVLPMTLRRWVKKAAAYTLDDLDSDLADLSQAGFVVVDDDSEEVLVRSLLRNDGIYQQPNVLRAAVATAPAIQSVAIKRALLAEVDRLDLSVVSDAAPKRAGDPTTREVVAALLDDLREGIAVPPENPSPNPSRKGSDNPSGNPSGQPSGTLPARDAGTPYAGAGARPLVLSPTPTPSTTAAAEPRKQTELAIVEDSAETAATVVAAYVDACREFAQIEDSRAKGRIAKDAASLLRSGAPHALLVTAARNLAANGFADLGAEARRLNARPAEATRPRVSASDAAARQALEAGARVQARHEREGA